MAPRLIQFGLKYLFWSAAGRYTMSTMRLLGILFVLVWTAAAQPHYDLLLKGGHVIDAKNRIDGVRDVAIAGGRIARWRRRSTRRRRARW